MNMWAVYYNPRDFPGKYVARLFVSRGGEAVPTNRCHVGDTLESVRASLPDGLYQFPRQPEDEPQIVEVWL